MICSACIDYGRQFPLDVLTTGRTYWHDALHKRRDVMDHQQVKDDLSGLDPQIIVSSVELLHEERKRLFRHPLYRPYLVSFLPHSRH